MNRAEIISRNLVGIIESLLFDVERLEIDLEDAGLLLYPSQHR